MARKNGLIRRLLRVFGILVAPQQGQLIVLTRRFPFVVLGLAVCCLIAFGGFFYYTNKPGFCRTCHNMDPYVDSYEASSHNTVSCRDCHFQPGLKNYLLGEMVAVSDLVKTLTATQGLKPRAEVEDASCLREGCHETRLLKDGIVFKGSYKFDHAPHLGALAGGRKLRCATCHSHIVEGEHFSVNEGVCFICHFKGRVHERFLDPVAGCLSCHEPPQGPVQLAGGESFDHGPFLARGVQCWKCHLDSVRGTGGVPRQACLQCHGEPEKLAKYGAPQLLHEWHVTTRKVECYRCHSEIRHGLAPRPDTMGPSCASCHSGGHSLQAAMFAGRGGKGVEGAPSPHSRAQVDCVACHELPAPEHGVKGGEMVSYEAGQKACLECHGSAMEGTLEMWKEALDDSLAEARAELAKAEGSYEALKGKSPDEARMKALLDEARQNCEFVAKARGVHNPEYALDLLDKAAAAAREAAGLARRAGPAAQTDGSEE